MSYIDHNLVHSHQSRLRAEADAYSRARRLRAAHRWNRRVQRATQRAARASAAIW